MPEPYSNSAEVRFLDRQAIRKDLSRAAARARAEHPEITRVLLFGSLVQGNWTADSDADLIVVVRKDFADLLERSRYHIHSPLIPTDTLVYSEQEFDRLAAEPGSFVQGVLTAARDV